jgi:SAM-dependent methyltransferase
VSRDVSVQDRLRRYYTAYYRDTLGIPDWPELVRLRQTEEGPARQRLERLQELLGGTLRGSRVLVVGCGTGGFDTVATGAGAQVVGVDTDGEALAICGVKRAPDGAHYARAAAEALPFRDDVFDLVHCFSVIEHVESVERSIEEMVRVARRGGAIYLHTPNAWSWYEGHYKLFWVPFLPRAVGRLYLRLRGRPTEYLRTLRRLTPTRVARDFARAGVTALTRFDADRPRESVGPLRVLTGAYYRLFGIAPFIELVARKP